MKHLAKILALFATASVLLALTALLCRRHKLRRRARYLTLYNHSS